MEHQHQWNDFNIVSNFTIQFEKVQNCDCGMFRIIERGTTEWQLMKP
jgi:hypothetical protein